MATVSANAQSTRLFAIPVDYTIDVTAPAAEEAGAGAGVTPGPSTEDTKERAPREQLQRSGTALVYVNSLTTSAPSKEPQLMIVPFPNPGGEAALKHIVLTPYAPWKEATDEIMDAFPVEKYRGGMFGASSPSPPRSVPLRPVHRVGAYKCSVVPDVATLLSTVNWSAFDVAPDLESRLSVLHDTRVCPKGCGFVVAQAVEDIEQDGFAVIYPGNDIMMPTCHEAPSSPPRGAMPVVMYDVVCYAVGTKLRWRGDLTNVKHKSCASASMKSVLQCLQGIGGITALDASPARVSASKSAAVCDSDGRVVLGRLQLFGENVNTNVFVRGCGNFNPENPELQVEALTRGRRLPPLRTHPAYISSEEEW